MGILYVIVDTTNYPVFVCDNLDIAKEKYDMDEYSYCPIYENQQSINNSPIFEQTKKVDLRKSIYGNRMYEPTQTCDGTCETEWNCEFNEECKVTNIYSYEFFGKHVVENIYKREILYDTKKLESEIPEGAVDWKDEFTK